MKVYDAALFSFFCLIFVGCKSNAALLMFELDTSTQEIQHVKNCTCFLGSPTCTSTQLLASPFCTCIPVSIEDIRAVATNAEASNTSSWWNADPLTICCESSSTATAAQVLDNLVDFSHTSRLTMHFCGGLVPTSDSFFTVYGLQQVTIQTDTSTNNPIQFLSMSETDLALAGERSREYRDYHIAFISRLLLDGDSAMKSWSAWLATTEAASFEAAMNRAPPSILSKADGNIMVTPIYV